MRTAGHAEAVWAAVSPWVPGLTVEVLPTIDSTNSELMRRARAGQTDPCLLMAHEQSAGRGRMGKTWVGQRGDALTFSIGLPLAPADWSGLSLAIGLALAKALHPSVRLKWPNDLWLDERKLGGILVETCALEGAGPQRWVVIGAGINLRAPTALPAMAASPTSAAPMPPAGLHEWLPDTSPGYWLEVLAPPLIQAVLRFEKTGFGPLVEDYAERDALQGREVWVSNGQTGTACGVDPSGALLLQTPGGLVTLTHHEVSVRPC
jgi:BirA family biotin operon repressor/biotin-[acetyl-CoA-carboxylase] ligase